MKGTSVAHRPAIDPAPSSDPIDLVQALADAYEWTCERRDETSAAVRFRGRWCDLRLWFAWRPEARALFVSCALDTLVPESRRDAIYPLLAGINERLWIGHFELRSGHGRPTFRHTLFGEEAPFGLGVLEEVVEAARVECDRYYPAFQFVLWRGEDAAGAIAASLADTAGEA